MSSHHDGIAIFGPSAIGDIESNQPALTRLGLEAFEGMTTNEVGLIEF